MSSTIDANPELRPDYLSWVFNDESLVTHRAQLPAAPEPMTTGLDSFIESMPVADDRWWDAPRKLAFIESLSTIQAARLTALRQTPGVSFRTAYRRTRNGIATWEMRPDEISGCLRTARGGSSKQAVVRVSNTDVQIRWMTPLEYARLMGAGDYNLTGARTNQALFAFGDAVSWLAENYLMPLTKGVLTDSRVLDLNVAEM
jgi:DNA (cytosine-5)-methyltransferase 1